MLDNNEDYITEEMEKQKKKLRDIGNVLENQHQLLRLIIQVSEIRIDTISDKKFIWFLCCRKWKLKRKQMMLMKVFRQMTLLSQHHQHAVNKVRVGIHL